MPWPIRKYDVSKNRCGMLAVACCTFTTAALDSDHGAGREVFNRFAFCNANLGHLWHSEGRIGKAGYLEMIQNFLLEIYVDHKKVCLTDETTLGGVSKAKLRPPDHLAKRMGQGGASKISNQLYESKLFSHHV